MAAERIIGVDFGTSTSVIRVKSYENNDYQGQNLDTKEVIFGGMGAMVPTLIQKKKDNESVSFYGFEAQQKKKMSTTYHSFKVSLENSDPDKRAMARKLTEEFFQYMAKQYKAQSEGGHLGKADEKERTIISYPVKWSEETRQFMIKAAEKAGFPNVTGMDEAQAAIQAVAVQSTDYLKQHGLLVSGVPSNVLLIDMGAGTTDLVLCRYTAGEKSEIAILNTWPKGGEVLFGGKEVDYLLQGFFRNLMKPEDAEKALKSIGVDQFKTWKETSVSPALSQKDAVTDFYALDNYANIVGIEIDDYKLDRTAFEECLKDYLKQLPELVNGCLQDAGMKGSEVDLVIVTGGHSQWYFVREMLAGKMTQFGEVGLTKIQDDASRIIPITRPQETVALGLVYSPIPVKVVGPKSTPKSDPEPTPKRDPKPTPTPEPTPIEDNTYLLDKVCMYGPILYFVASDKKMYRVDMLRADREEPYSSWKNLRAIAVGDHHKVGLREDGTVVAISTSSPKEGSCSDVMRWKNIRSIVCGSYYTIGVKEDGNVEVAIDFGLGHDYIRDGVRNWKNICTIVQDKSNDSYVVGLRKDGTVVQKGPLNLECWKNICSITSGRKYVVGLRKDGTVVASGYRDVPNVKKWSNIIAIASGDHHVGGLRENGTVAVESCRSINEFHVSEWNNIIAIACGSDHIVGLRKDGTVVATGENRHGQCNVSEWKDVIAIKANGSYTIGIRRDGRIIYTRYGIDAEYKTNLFGKRVIKSMEIKMFPAEITSVSIF